MKKMTRRNICRLIENTYLGSVRKRVYIWKAVRKINHITPTGFTEAHIPGYCCETCKHTAKRKKEK